MDGVVIEKMMFALFSALAIGTAGGVVFLRDAIRCAMSLIACFFSIAVLYILQAAELLAVLEVLVYAGAIMVLFVFVIMLVEHRDDPILKSSLFSKLAAGIRIGAVALVAINLLALVAGAAGELSTHETLLPEDFGSPAAVGRLFFSNYLFHFELASVLLLVAIVGAVIISREDTPRDKELP